MPGHPGRLPLYEGRTPQDVGGSYPRGPFHSILSTGFPERGEPPHGEGATPVMTDPLAQALALTAIVIGFATSALLLAFVYRMHEQHGSLDLRDVVHAELEEEQSHAQAPPEPEER